MCVCVCMYGLVWLVLNVVMVEKKKKEKHQGKGTRYAGLDSIFGIK